MPGPAAYGRFLYGENWRGRMAEALSVSVTEIRGWENDALIPTTERNTLLALVLAVVESDAGRQPEAAAAAAVLDQVGGGGGGSYQSPLWSQLA